MNRLLAALALLLAAVNANAQGFVELGLGQAMFDLDISAPASVDDKDTTWAISGGYMFHPNVGAEVGYRALGEVTASATVGPNTIRANEEVDGFMLGAVGRFPVADKLSIVPRVGLYIWDGKGAGTINGVQTASFDDDGSDIYFGVGAEYSVTKQFFAGAHWVRFDLDGDDVDVIELKVGLRF